MQEPSKNNSQPASCCSTLDCCNSGLDRRAFVKLTGLSTVALTLPTVMAGPFEASAAENITHFVPTDKKLDPRWVAALFDKGTSKTYRREELKTIGMPIGGIAAGQLYLSGDGRLVYWDIFNEHIFSGYGATNYNSNPPEAPVDQGFAVRVESEGKVETRPLSIQGFPNVGFIGEYPIAIVNYEENDFPLSITLEAFSPFIPLNAKDSALPATALQYTVKNKSNTTVKAALAGWLENAVCHNSRREMPGDQINTLRKKNGMTFIEFSARGKKEDKQERPPIVFADFEGSNYGAWKVEGEAFGSGPVREKLPNQQSIKGYQGQGLVNSFRGGDHSQGRLISPEFKIERPFINFLIGGGNNAAATGVHLVIDSKSVRTATGKNREPLQWTSWNVDDHIGKTAHIEIIDKSGGGWGHVNVDQFEFADRSRSNRQGALEEQEDYGTMGLALLNGSRNTQSSIAVPTGDLPEVLFAQDGSLIQLTEPNENGSIEREFGVKHRAALGRQFVLRPNEEIELTFAVTWFFPDKYIVDQPDNKDLRGRYYATMFDSAASVADYIHSNYKRLAGDTRLWHQTYYDSTLPHWLLDRLQMPTSYLATSTVQWFKSGRVWAWEGVGCCHGTCSHVWNYAHAMARLFPEMERIVRERQDLSVAMQEDGRIHFRGEFNDFYAADGQAGSVLKCYREHLLSPNDSFLKNNWPNIKRALLFLIVQDANDDGLIENTQHNTFDINFEGANTFVGSLYLGALRAGERMAQIVGEDDFARRCRDLFDKGSKLSMERLYDGEYFIQEVDLKKFPNHQYGNGCLSDQLFGQGWAEQIQLGYLYPRDSVRSALQAIYKYNWAPDVGPQTQVHKPDRYFIFAGEAGLLTCTWPKSEHIEKGVLYQNEVWTGIEYQVASHMLAEGMLTEGLAIIRAIHDRYDGTKHNPFNEVECGDHYARALASWSCLIALAGYEYDGPSHYIGFAPRITPEEFRSVFTAAEGWGSIEQTRRNGWQINRIQVAWGRLPIRSLSFEVGKMKGDSQIEVTYPGRKQHMDFEQAGPRLYIRLDQGIVLEPGQSFTVTIPIE